MLLLSVDAAYGRSLTRAKKTAAAIFKRHKVTWPNVWLEDGWNESMRRFNLGGYGLTLVGPDGIVRAIDIRESQLESRLDKMFDNTTRKPR